MAGSYNSTRDKRAAVRCPNCDALCAGQGSLMDHLPECEKKNPPASGKQSEVA
jgi:uncharacterized C2H2 Zn-finger protein